MKDHKAYFSTYSGELNDCRVHDDSDRKREKSMAVFELIILLLEWSSQFIKTDHDTSTPPSPPLLHPHPNLYTHICTFTASYSSSLVIPFTLLYMYSKFCYKNKQNKREYQLSKRLHFTPTVLTSTCMHVI